MGRMKSILTSPIGLGIILCLYSILGSISFFYFETNELFHKPVRSIDRHLENEIKEAIEELKEKSKDNKISSIYAQKIILNLKEKLKKEPEDQSKSLDFWKCLFYCYTIYTSIGYGNIFPTNAVSRIFTCFYALFGIPICLATLDRFGKMHTKLLNYVYKAFWKLLKKQAGRCSISCMILLISLYLVCGFYLYSANESWSLDETVYFLFVTFTTIGFGDICPNDSKYFVVTIIYQFFGLSLVASLLNMLVENFDWFMSSTESEPSKEKEN